MKEPEAFSVAEIAAEAGEDPMLGGFLVVEKQIPHKIIGSAKIVDGSGRKQLKAAFESYREKAGPIVPRKRVGRPVKKKLEPAAT